MNDREIRAALRALPGVVKKMSDTTDKLDQITTRLGTIAGTMSTSMKAVLDRINNNLPSDMSDETKAKITADLDKLGATADTFDALSKQLSDTGTLPGTITSPETGDQVKTDQGGTPPATQQQTT